VRILPPIAAAVGPDLRGLDALLGDHARTGVTMLVLLEVAVLLAAAKLMGWLAERCRVPGVIGELLAGVIVGPYLLGSLLHVPLHGHWVPLFPAPLAAGDWPVNPIVWTIAQFASVILLFVTGLHTDFGQFLKYLRPASLVAVVGLIVPFLLGVAVTGLGPFAALAVAPGQTSPLVPALFVGTILAATSIGITARVLGDIGKLDTPEGVTILGAAVLDDVLCIITLAIVGGLAAAMAGTGAAVTVGGVLLIAGKALGFWVALTLLVLWLAKPIERFLTGVKYGGAMAGLGLALAFACSAAAEGFGLAFIIGAYSVGLGLSRTKMAHDLMKQLEPVGDFFVPLFFASLGMLVNLGAMFASWQVVAFGAAVTAAAIVGKVAGCGAAALPVGFNRRGAYRIGIGMMPRGEVALIVAGIGLSQKFVGEVVFGVSITMTLVTTILAPILLVPAFATGGSGRKAKAADGAGPAEAGGRDGGRRSDVEADADQLPSASVLPAFEVRAGSAAVAELFVDRLLALAVAGGWEPSYEDADGDLSLLRSGSDAASVRRAGGRITVDASDRRQAEFVGFAEAVRESLAADVDAIAVATPMPAATANASEPN
jgi:Kef-type K+ transport system membrane component KefB